MTTININNSDDDNYRYKMEEIIIELGGKGNGIFTIVNNLNAISKSLNTPEEILIKYLCYYLNSNYNEKKKTYSGHHQKKSFEAGIFKYINSFVLCPTCGIPELFYQFNNSNVNISCSACGKIQIIKPQNKIDIKCFDYINKFLQKGNLWCQIEGNMVVQNNNIDIDEDFNPFFLEK